MKRITAVIFDIGGVVTESPLHAIERYERDQGIETNAINRAIVTVGDGGAWARLERGELTIETFLAPFEADCRTCGITLGASRMMDYIAEARVLRPRMLEAIRRLREHGLRVAALTNNWKRLGESEDNAGGHQLRDHFHVVVESRVVGLRKPDPRIYGLVCRELDVEPSRTAFLDDIGRNLKTARALGMATIKVDDPAKALCELSELVGFELG